MVSRQFGVVFGRFGVVWGVSTDPTTLYDKNFVIIYSSIGVSYV